MQVTIANRSIKSIMKNIKLPKKYETCDWLWKNHNIDLTDEHVKRLTNAINILKSIGEHTDAKFLKEIQDKLLELHSKMKEVDLEKEYKDFVEEDPVYNKLVNGIVGKAIAKHFFELGLKAQKGE